MSSPDPHVARSFWPRRPGDQAGAALSARCRKSILSAADVPYPANSVFNPAAARVGNETILLVPRRGSPRGSPSSRGPGAERHRLAASIDHSSRRMSIGIPRRPGAARIRGSPGCPSAMNGRLPTAYSRRGPLVGLATTRDFREVVASVQSCHPRTRTPPSSLGSTVAGP